MIDDVEGLPVPKPAIRDSVKAETLFGRDLLAAHASVMARRRAGERGTEASLELARVLARLGSWVDARAELRRASRGHELNARSRRELFGIRASSWRSTAEMYGLGLRRDRCERAAIAAYRRAFDADGDAWPAVAIASLHAIRGEGVRAREWAGRAMDALTSGRCADEWKGVTRAETLLVLGQLDRASAEYRAAPLARSGRFTDRASARRQATRILQASGLSHRDRTLWLEAALPSTVVGIVVGHMIDRDDRAVPRFPQEHTQAVLAAIQSWIEDRGVEFGFASAATGADLLFHRALRSRGAQSRVVLPCPPSTFRANSVEYAGAEWTGEFDALIAGGDEWVSLASIQAPGGNHGWLEYASEFLEGLAHCKAAEVDGTVQRLVVWDGREGDGPGGTFATVERWRTSGCPFDVIDPLRPHLGYRRHDRHDGQAVMRESGAPDIVGLLTADATGYGRLTDDELTRFAAHALPAIRGVLDMADRSRGERPFFVSTWGDGLLMGFDDLGALARVALDLRDRFDREPWPRYGLPADLSLRIALHAGPVQRIVNPVTGRADLLGSHVSHVARLEPAVVRGLVYATEGFAALQQLRCPGAARCTLVGRAPWAKNYGAETGGLPMYRVDRKGN